MRRKISYINGLLVFCGLLLAMKAGAQVTITVPQANLQNGTNYVTTLTSGSYTGTALFQSIWLQGSAPILRSPSGTSFPVNNLGITLMSINGVNLFSGSTPINLTTSPQSIYSALLSLSSGPIQLQYTVPIPAYAWSAGSYTTTLIYTLGSIGSVVGPGLLTINIPAYIVTPASLPIFTLNVNNLADYSTTTVSATGSMTASSTVPYKIEVKSNSANFTYSSTLGLSNPSNLAVSNVLGSVNSGAGVSLSATTQNLTASAIPVSGGNNQTQTIGFSLSPASLLSQFVQAGTYTVPLTFTTSDASASPSVANQTTTGSLVVNVSDMQALLVNDATTTLTFSTAANYSSGVTQDQTNHLTVSSTTPWGIAVKTSSANLVNGSSTIPVTDVTVGDPTGQTLLPTTALSTTAQNLILSQAPAIAKTVGVRYAVSAANAQSFISLPSGTYTTTVTYTLSAL